MGDPWGLVEAGVLVGGVLGVVGGEVVVGVVLGGRVWMVVGGAGGGGHDICWVYETSWTGRGSSFDIMPTLHFLVTFL